MLCNVYVKRVPESAKKYNYIIATVFNNELHYYGATNDYEKAIDICANYSENRVIIQNTISED